VFCRDFIAGSGLDVFILPVGIVDLQLNELCIRMLRQQLIEEVRSVVEREAPVLYDPLFLQLADIIPETIVIVFFDIAPSQSMQQIEIKIACPGALEADPQFILGRLLILRGKL
jgi:hypothetical protein